MKDSEIKNKLSPAQISVMRHRVTEPPYFGRFWDHFDAGTYRCAACSTPLFNSHDKFDLKTGWPTFKKPINEKDLQFKSEPGPDDKVEIRCKKCKSHLGYVIAHDPPYYRVNSVCLTFEAAKPDAAPVVSGSPLAPTPPESTPPETNISLDEVPQPRSIGPVLALVTGIVVGLIVGGGGVWLYLNALEAAPTTINNATSTDMVATSSVDGATELESTAIDSNIPAVETSPEAQTDTSPNSAIQGFESPTSTQ